MPLGAIACPQCSSRGKRCVICSNMVPAREKPQVLLRIAIERAQLKHVPDVLRLIKELAAFELEPDAVVVTEAILLADGFGPHPAYQCWVAIVDAEVVGMALTYTRYSTWKGRRCYLEDIIVQHSHRRLGIGEQLFDAVVAYASVEGHSAVCWQVLDWNAPAIEFYKKKGAVQKEGWLDYQLLVADES